MNPKRQTVLILSSDPAFSRDVTEAWPSETEVPDFVVLKEDLYPELRGDSYDLAITEAGSRARRQQFARFLTTTGKPAILVYDVHSGSTVESAERCSLVFALSRKSENWAALVGMLGGEILRHLQADARASEAEQRSATSEAYATLGRYMVEMRHTTTNAITSILGNAELLQQEPGLRAPVLSQADTIRNMALRLHELFQRFFSLEKELSVLAREGYKETGIARGVGRR